MEAMEVLAAMKDTSYNPRRKVVVEKFSIFERSKIISFLKDKKMEYAMQQKYEIAAHFRELELDKGLDYNIIEEYVFILKQEQTNKTITNHLVS